MTHITAISSGQGPPSTYMIILAGETDEPPLCDVSLVITADTGWENDMLWSTGERTTSREYFERTTKPLAAEYGIEAVFVRSLKKNADPYPPLPHTQFPRSLDLPLFGSNGGKLQQSCTSKWKIAAIRQELRRRGAKKATTCLGLTMDEVHRMKPSDKLWNPHMWPLIDCRLYRREIIDKLNHHNIPYLITTECDGCPHKDPVRWLRTSPETIKELTQFEARFNGEYFLTRELIPLNEAVEKYRQADEAQPSLFDGCDGGYCFT